MPITELNSTQLPSLNLITMLSFEPRLRMLSLTVTTQKANACSPWTPCYLSFSEYFTHCTKVFVKNFLHYVKKGTYKFVIFCLFNSFMTEAVII